MAYWVAGKGDDAHPPVDCGLLYRPPLASGGGACVDADHASAPGYEAHWPHVVMGRMSLSAPPRWRWRLVPRRRRQERRLLGIWVRRALYNGMRNSIV
jgi:hypothetical protein